MKSNKLYTLVYRFINAQIFLGAIAYILYNIDNRHHMFTCDAGLACILQLPGLLFMWALALGALLFFTTYANREFVKLRKKGKPERFYRFALNYCLITISITLITTTRYFAQNKQYTQMTISQPVLVLSLVITLWSILTVVMLRKIMHPVILGRATKVLLCVVAVLGVALPTNIIRLGFEQKSREIVHFTDRELYGKVIQGVNKSKQLPSTLEAINLSSQEIEKVKEYGIRYLPSTHNTKVSNPYYDYSYTKYVFEFCASFPLNRTWGIRRSSFNGDMKNFNGECIEYETTVYER